MPRKPIDYSNTIIYKIVCKDLNVADVYVGHTTDFTNRKRSHKCRCNCETQQHYNLKLYQFIRANKGWTNFEIIEIEKYPCDDANEARAKERFWYEELNSTLNIRVPNRSDKESKKVYKELNKEQMLKQNKEYRENNKEKILEIQKIYREKNKDIVNEKHRVYINKNKDKINERRRAIYLQKKSNNQAKQQLITTNLDCNNTDC